MTVKTMPLRIDMGGGTQIENVTKFVQEALAHAKVTTGIVTVFVQHTTASVMVIEDEPGIRLDTKTFLRGQLQGPSVTIPFSNGSLLLGTWQQIVVVDFDTRARTRELIIQILGE